MEQAVQSDELTSQEKTDLNEVINFIRNDRSYFIAFESLEIMRSEGNIGGAYTTTEAGAIVTVFANNFFDFYEGYEDSYPGFNAQDTQAAVAGHEGKHGVQLSQGLTLEAYNRDKRRYERPANRIEQSINRGLGTLPKCKIGGGSCKR